VSKALTSLDVGYMMNRAGERDTRYRRAYQYSRLGSDDLSSSDRINQTKSSYPIFPSALLVNLLGTLKSIIFFDK
jgi:hypothetical protein